MILVTFNHNGEQLNGVLLATYNRGTIPTKELLEKRKLLGIENSPYIFDDTKCFLVYSPKSTEQKVLEIKACDMGLMTMNLVAEWIYGSKFDSVYIDEWFGVEQIRDFNGYPFIYENKNFIASVLYGDVDMNLLFTHCPKLKELK